MQTNLRLNAAPPMTVASRFGTLAFLFIGAMILYWIGGVVGVSFLLKERLGQEDSTTAGFVVASIVVPVSGYFYAAHVCKTLSRFSLAVSDRGFGVTAMKFPGFTKSEIEFPYCDVERVVYGQKLNGMEEFLNRLDQSGVPGTSQHIVRDLKQGQLFVIRNNGERFAFHFLDKAFDDDQLLQFFSALNKNDVVIEHGGNHTQDEP